MKRRVAITGMGLVTPLGIGLSDNWNALMEGRSGVCPLTKFDASEHSTKIAAEVKNWDPSEQIDFKLRKQMDTFTEFAVVAADQAMSQAGLKVTDQNAARIGTLVGTGIGGIPELEANHRKLIESGPRRVSPFFIPKMIGNLASGHISMRYGTKGPNLCILTACTTGTHSVGESARMIRHGYADAMICGGAEATISELTIAGFSAMRALSKRNDEPEKASRPFDRDRDGFIMGEGAGVMVLEAWEHAVERGATILGEVLGYGVSSDAHHISAPSPGGEGAALSMQNAIEDAGIAPEDIGYINAHGTSTPLNDKYETMAIRTVFGAHADKLKVSSTKSMTGHLLGGSGGIESVFTVQMLQHQRVAPTMNLDNPDPECDLDYVPNQAQDLQFDLALSNSFGFGGTNGTLIFKRHA
jgi:3-oxoacyl-[acyl-carrier-protein] synthase II